MDLLGHIWVLGTSELFVLIREPAGAGGPLQIPKIRAQMPVSVNWEGVGVCVCSLGILRIRALLFGFTSVRALVCGV